MGFLFSLFFNGWGLLPFLNFQIMGEKFLFFDKIVSNSVVPSPNPLHFYISQTTIFMQSICQKNYIHKMLTYKLFSITCFRKDEVNEYQ